MTEADGGAPSGFEALEARLETALEKLEDSGTPLEERIRFHTEAVRLHAEMERVLEAARKEVAAADDSPGAPRPSPAGEPVADEPYERVLDRLKQTVEEMEQDDLPLARILDLHRQAGALAERCETILKSAQDTLEGSAAREVPSEPPAAHPTVDEDDAVPF